MTKKYIPEDSGYMNNISVNELYRRIDMLQFNLIWHNKLPWEVNGVGENYAFYPHQDVHTKYASSIFLNLPGECNGGTSFFKGKQMGTQKWICYDCYQRYSNAPPETLPPQVPKFVDGHFTEEEIKNAKYLQDVGWDHERFESWNNEMISSQGTEYLIEDSEHWELLGFVPMKYNRLILYNGNYFHSVYMKKEWFEDFPRLSQQTFF